jgi:phage regulator Rha-like protein
MAAGAPTMSTKEIADLTGKRHDNVKRTIERLAAQGVIALPPMEEVSFTGADGRSQRTTEYRSASA